MKYTHHSNYFYGNKISDYGLKNGYVDYATLAKSFDAVLANNIMSKSWDCGEWEIVNGDDRYYFDDDGNEISAEEYDENGGDYEYFDVYQYYIISESGYQILTDCTNEIVWYHEELDLYVWGVTHFGTSWDYVLTDIKIVK